MDTELAGRAHSLLCTLSFCVSVWLRSVLSVPDLFGVAFFSLMLACFLLLHCFLLIFFCFGFPL